MLLAHWNASFCMNTQVKQRCAWLVLGWENSCQMIDWELLFTRIGSRSPLSRENDEKVVLRTCTRWSEPILPKCVGCRAGCCKHRWPLPAPKNLGDTSVPTGSWLELNTCTWYTRCFIAKVPLDMSKNSTSFNIRTTIRSCINSQIVAIRFWRQHSVLTEVESSRWFIARIILMYNWQAYEI